MKRLASVVVLWAVCGAISSFGQTADLKELLSGKTIPLSLKLKDLDEQWRCVRIEGSGNWTEAYAAMLGGGNNPYYTKGQTVALAGETYLVTYRAPTASLNSMQIMLAQRQGNPPAEPQKLTADTALSLSLLNLRTINSLQEIRLFNLKDELAASEKQGQGLVTATAKARDSATAVSSLSNLHQLAQAVHLYSNDWREEFPPMKDANSVKKALYPNYVSSEATFLHPQTKQPYQPNTSLGGKTIPSITNPDQVVMFYEAMPADNGTRGVAFVDGHAVLLVSEKDQWPKLKQASGIP